jgi:DMSO/TMAO reductase YedYZ molybdopterin-dependent catalytic subunit
MEWLKNLLNSTFRSTCNEKRDTNYRDFMYSAIGELGGVPMSYIISLCRPLPQARYVVYYSYQYTKEAQFYEAIHIELAKHYQTILAYEMNGEPLAVPQSSITAKD